MTVSTDVLAELTSLGVSTIYEAAGRTGLIDADLVQVISGSRVAGPARTVLCGQNDNRAVHASIERIRPGEVLVLTMPTAAPVALIGELLAIQAKTHGAAAILVDASVRDVVELRELGLPVWSRWVRSTGASKSERGELDGAVTMGGTSIAPGDIVVLDTDGAVVIEQSRINEVLRASLARRDKEDGLRTRWASGELSYDAYGMRDEDAKGDANAAARADSS